MGPVGEWIPGCGVTMQILGGLGLAVHAIGGMVMLADCVYPHILSWELAPGSSRNKEELTLPRTAMGILTPS